MFVFIIVLNKVGVRLTIVSSHNSLTLCKICL